MAYIQFDVLPPSPFLSCNHEINKSASMFESNLSLCQLFTFVFYMFFFLFLHDAALFVGVSPPCPMLHNFNQPFMKWQTGVADWRLIHAMLQYNFIRARNVAYE